jgi:hypothetical protein
MKPTNQNLPGLTDFQDKFLLFQECVFTWLAELNEDLLRVKAARKDSKSGAETKATIIPFPARPGNRFPRKKEDNHER